MSSQKPNVLLQNLRKASSKTLELSNKAMKKAKALILDPFDDLYVLRSGDTSTLNPVNTWTYFKAQYVKDDKRDDYKTANHVDSEKERFSSSTNNKINFLSVMSPIKLLNPFRHLYNLVTYTGVGVARAVDAIIPSKYIEEKKVMVNGIERTEEQKVESNAAIKAKTILLAPFALVGGILKYIANLDRYLEPLERPKKDIPQDGPDKYVPPIAKPEANENVSNINIVYENIQGLFNFFKSKPKNISKPTATNTNQPKRPSL